MFTLKDVFLAITLIALGCGVLSGLRSEIARDFPPLWRLLFFSGTTLICTGVLTPFHLKRWGALVGLLICFAFVWELFVPSVQS